MRQITGILAGLALLEGCTSARAAEPPAAPIGRYVVVASAVSAQDVVLLDSQTGRTWLMCNTHADSTLSRQSIIANNWCEMRRLNLSDKP